MDLTVVGRALFVLVTFYLSSVFGNNTSTVNLSTSTVNNTYVPTSTLSISTNSTQVTTNIMSTTPRLKITTSKTMTSGTSSSSNTSKTSSSVEDQDPDKTALIIGVAFACSVLVILMIIIIMYLRNSPLCYQCLRHRSRQSSDAFEFNSVQNTTTSFTPIRTRLASLSSIRRQVICRNDPFSITDFREHVKRLHADSDYLFSMEYEAVGGKKYLNDEDKKQELSMHQGRKANNKAKNRYSDILPYDHSRVALTELEGQPDSVYINANYVDSYRKPNAYIAAQGPLPASLDDFWRMVWENNSRVIVMVTNLFERMKSKCVQYWPDEGSSTYGLLTVTMVKEESFSNYIIRTLSVQPSANQHHYIQVKSENESGARVIEQFQFSEWPDHDIPVHPVALLRFIRHSSSAGPPDAGPPVIHCSAGVGRSGVYMVIDSAMERIEDDKTVDVFNFLNHIRTQRMALVQEERQYIFVHDCILEHINFGDTNIPIREFRSRLRSLRTVGPGAKKNRLREEFEDIDRMKHPEKHKWAGKKNCNIDKNRKKDILPVERTRVKLPPVLGMSGGDYINASFIDGFKKKREYIVTQAPMVTTAECFYRMMRSTDCRIIVMILDDEQWKKDDYADLPTEDEAVTCGKFEVHLESQEVLKNCIVRKLRLFSSDMSDGRTITHYHYRAWPTGGIPKDKTSLIEFIERVREHKIEENSDRPITVHCNYGIGPGGAFCLLSSLYDQIEYEKCVDIFQAAKLCCIQRPKVIETEEQYVFCYEVIDEIIARKRISSGTDPDIDDTNAPGNLGKKNPDPDVVRNHTPEINGSVVKDNSAHNAGKNSPKLGSLNAGEYSPILGNGASNAGIVNTSVGIVSPSPGSVSPEPTVVKRNTSGGIDNPFVENNNPTTESDDSDADTDNPIADIGSPSAGNEALNAESPKSESPMAATESRNDDSPDDESPEHSDNERVNKTTSSRQALLTSSDSSS